MDSPLAVQAVRKQLFAAGFKPVPVYTGDKRPCGDKWEQGARQLTAEQASQWPLAAAMSTGILTDGLRVVDIDVDDPGVADTVARIAWQILGTCPIRRRDNSPRCLMVYRAADGEPKKRVQGKVDILGRGQQFVAFGQHPTGAAYKWTQDISLVNRNDLTAVTEEQVTSFLETIRQHVGGDAVQRPIQSQPTFAHVTTDRERKYAQQALADEIAKLKALQAGSGRNNALNTAAHNLGTCVSYGLDLNAAAYALLGAAQANGHVAKHGEQQTKATIDSGLRAGMEKPRSPLSSDLPQVNTAQLKVKGQPAINGTAEPAAPYRKSIKFTRGADIQAEPITWLWHGYLPKGKLTLLAGSPGNGKSTLAFNLAATVTNGGFWPDGTRCDKPGLVVIWSSEDDAADTIKPRMTAANANDNAYAMPQAVCEDGSFVTFDPANDIDALREKVKEIGGVSLLILDPIVSAVTGDMHRANDVRRSLQAIVDFATEFDCAVLGITHFAKNTGGRNPLDRVLGSQGFGAFARMVLVTAKEEGSDLRVFTRAKSNISVDHGGFHYSIEPCRLTAGIETIRLVWGEAVNGSARDILATVEESDEKEDGPKLQQAKTFLQHALSGGPLAVVMLIENAGKAAISEKTLRRAQRALGIQPVKVGFQGVSCWALPYRADAILQNGLNHSQQS